MIKSSTNLFGLKVRASLLIGVLTLASAVANAAQYRTQFEPLIGSDWAIAHPNELPFSKCAILDYRMENENFWDLSVSKKMIASKDTWNQMKWRAKSFQSGLGVSALLGSEVHFKSVDPEYEPVPVLTCVSFKHGVAYQIPVALSRSMTFFEAGVSIGKQRITFSPSSLNGKELKSIFGTYGGPEAGASLFLSHSRALLLNKKGVIISRKFTGLGIGIKSGAVGFKVQEADDENSWMKHSILNDPFLLVNDNQGVQVINQPLVQFDSEEKSVIQLAQNQQGSANEIKVAKPAFGGFSYLQVTEPTVTALDNSTVYDYRSGVFFASKKASFANGEKTYRIYHAPKKSVYYRAEDESLDYTSLGKFRFRWDEREE